MRRDLNMLAAALLIAVLTGCGGGITAFEVGGDYDDLIAQGWQHYNQFDYEAAQSLFDAARSFDDQRPEAYIGDGWSLLRRQKPDSALVVFFQGFDYIASLGDSVDSICGISGSYLARRDNTKVITFLKQFDLPTFESSFPLEHHDFSLDLADLELVFAQAFYRLGLYSSTESADPDNAVYHLNRTLFIPHEYTDPEALMAKINEILYGTEGGG